MSKREKVQEGVEVEEEKNLLSCFDFLSISTFFYWKL